MDIDLGRVDALLQLALAAASQEDDLRDRELGPIHLVKYAYLADLAFAERHGHTFTSAPWAFHHFGPWALGVYERIDSALAPIAPEQNRLTSAFDTDFVRYSMDPVEGEATLRSLERQLPGEVYGAVRGAVHEFGGDTASLLRHVYLTRPILQAAPGEVLVFEAQPHDGEVAAASPEPAPLTVRERRQQRARRDALRNRVRASLAEKAQRRAGPTPPPRYDDIYVAGVAWLESLAGEPVPESGGDLLIDRSVWHSRARQDPDVS